MRFQTEKSKPNNSQNSADLRFADFVCGLPRMRIQRISRTAFSKKPPLGLRLGAQIITEYECACGARVDELGYFSLSCRLGPERQARHTAVNEYLVPKGWYPGYKRTHGFDRGRSLYPLGLMVTLSPHGRKDSPWFGTLPFRTPWLTDILAILQWRRAPLP
ncbi:hypothetical protein HELRODRAFT_168096 [Helobdella robusta]|uniref:Uncharacterized protein n=1 Tax=Helobdella robusta TaxID=6412 RepID=T1F058_HELRO|nr:hypothetical protein HELRODRAFT_168096 [Helobdella robusta]ESO10213.1 hypothetical protein HELRODRAFT_168096 [Helobdella robusta]